MAKMILQLAAPSHRPSPRLRADEVNEQHRKFSTLEREVYEHKRARIDAFRQARIAEDRANRSETMCKNMMSRAEHLQFWNNMDQTLGIGNIAASKRRELHHTDRDDVYRERNPALTWRLDHLSAERRRLEKQMQVMYAPPVRAAPIYTSAREEAALRHHAVRLHAEKEARAAAHRMPPPPPPELRSPRSRPAPRYQAPTAASMQQAMHGPKRRDPPRLSRPGSARSSASVPPPRQAWEVPPGSPGSDSDSD